MITDHLFSDPSKTSLVRAVPYSMSNRNQRHDTRSPDLSFMAGYESNRARISDDPDAFSRDMRFILNALS